MEYVLLIIGLFAGGLLGFFISKSSKNNFVSKSEYEAVNSELNNLKIQTGSSFTREEIEKNYARKETLEEKQKELDELKVTEKELRKTISEKDEGIRLLTSQSEQKLSKEEVDQKFIAKKAYDDLKANYEEVVSVQKQKEDEVIRLNKTVSELKTREDALKEYGENLKKSIDELKSQATNQFKTLAQEILEEKGKIFTEANKKELDTVVKPLHEDLEKLQKKVDDTRKEEIKDITSLKSEISSLKTLNERLSEDAQHLANALKSDSKVQGDWGENRLKLILETEGLEKYIDFDTQFNLYDEQEEKNKRPDMIFNLPGGKKIIIDSKVSLTSYSGYFNTSDVEQKKQFLKEHIRSIKNHIDDLSGKEYQRAMGKSSFDYILMFMPIESALTIAVSEDNEIFGRALQKDIVLVTPTTLMLSLKIIKMMWQQDAQIKNIDEIIAQSTNLYAKFVDFLEEMNKIQSGLNAAQNSYNEAKYKLSEGKRKSDTIIGKFKRIKELGGADTKKEIPDEFIKDIELLSDDENTK